jgi:hypothetical protein
MSHKVKSYCNHLKFWDTLNFVTHLLFMKLIIFSYIYFETRLELEFLLSLCLRNFQKQHFCIPKVWDPRLNDDFFHGSTCIDMKTRQFHSLNSHKIFTSFHFIVSYTTIIPYTSHDNVLTWF